VHAVAVEPRQDPPVVAQELVERGLARVQARVRPVAVRDAGVDDEVAIAGAGVVRDAAG
jgi:hypothetical protein